MNLTQKKKTINSFLWSFLGQFGNMVIIFITNIILARILSPYEFGQIGIIMFFIILGKIFSESGLAGALIRKPQISQQDYSTVFIFNFFISIIFFLILLFFSESISNFYEDPALKTILIAISFVLVTDSFQITQNAQLIRNLEYKKKSKYNFIAIGISSLIGIILALNGAGVWALVFIQLFGSLTLSIILWTREKSFNRIIFSVTSFSSMYKFGVNTTLASLINTFFENIYQLILGKFFSIGQAGLFYQAKKLQDVPVSIIKSTTLGVMFSSLAKFQNDENLFKEIYIKIITPFIALTGLICLITYLFADNLILLLYGSEWIEAAFYLKILILSSYFFIAEMFNRVIFKVFDKTHIILNLEIIKKIIQGGTVILGVIYLNIDILLYGILFTNIIAYGLNLYQSKFLIKNSALRELLIFMKIMIIVIMIMGAFYFYISIFDFTGYSQFSFLPFLIIIYILSLKYFNVFNSLREVPKLIAFLKKK